ncbi:MAG: hypothetical protein DHS20C16_15260 [Phycisphaerae bacterium]|nr:MAG: hypothetical protein DHS20C16_15260 [Phycisphaerae bacterium]
MAQLEIYEHSGRLGTGMIVVPLMGVIVSVAAGIGYSYANVYVPVVGPIVSTVLAFAVGGLVGVTVSAGALISKCRSAGFVKIAGVACGLIALYSAWASFAYILLQRAEEAADVSLLRIFGSPDYVWEFAKAVNEDGWFSFRSMTPKGTMLWVLWACEAIVFLVLTPIVSLSLIVDRVFCETTEQWCERQEKYVSLTLGDDAKIVDRIADGDISALEELPIYDGSDAPRFHVDLHKSSEDLGTRAMKVEFALTKKDASSPTDEVSNDVTPIFLLSNEQYQRIEALANREPPVHPTPEN